MNGEFDLQPSGELGFESGRRTPEILENCGTVYRDWMENRGFRVMQNLGLRSSCFFEVSSISLMLSSFHQFFQF